MGKLSFEDKINLYNDRKSGVSISSLCSKYKILHANVEYLTRLIDKHGYDILRKNRNRKFTSYEKERIINLVLLNNESLLSVAIDEGLSSPGMLANWIKNFRADNPNEKWYTDVTEFNLRGEKMLFITNSRWI